MINITDLGSTINNNPNPINLTSIKIYKLDAGTFALVRFYEKPYIDGNSSFVTPPFPVQDNVTLKFDPQFFDIMRADFSKIYINLTFQLDQPSSFLNNTLTNPFDYNYHPANVTQPRLRDAIVEVAVW
jgi:hypothetical protein